MLDTGKDATGLRFTLSVGSLPPDTFVVSSYTLHEQLSALFELELEVASGNPSVEFHSILDNNATLTIWRNTEVLRIVNGIISSVEQGDTGRHQTCYRLSVRPMLWRAGLGRRSRIFQQQDFLTILETLLKENKISDYDHAFRHLHGVREFCVQYDESDLEFINRLAAEEGIYYLFEHGNNTHTVVFFDDSASSEDGPTLPYYPSSTEQADELCITSFRRRESVRTSEVLLKDYTFKDPLWGAEYRDYGRDTEHQPNRYMHYDYPGRYKDSAGKAFARWRVQALRNDAHQGEGTSNSPALLPGKRFILENHPLESNNRRWQISGATHIGRQPQALEKATGGQGTTLVCQFAFIPDIQTWRPHVLPKPRIDGAQIAIVTGPDTEEIFCDNYGRVKVRFLWDRSGRTDDTSSCWIRVSHPWAGPRWGMSAIPRIGHEVIVEFLNGDPDQPVIIGRTYHASNLPPGNLPGTKTQMSIRSQTHKGDGFNELRFEDEKDNEEVFIHAQKNMAIRVLNSKDERVAYNRSSSIGHDEEIVIANNRTLTVEGQQDQKTTGNFIELIEGDNHLHIKGDLSQKIDGSVGMHVSNELVFHSDSKITFRVGGSFIAIHSGGVDIKAPMINLNSGGAASEVALPSSPRVLAAAAAEGALFVAHCPNADK
ncbi:type VI secretion system Vgr family protein [Serratia silvae]|uniref:Type VI secretion system tip protein VgrG n=1 Tax=Serratia silvae TaxID=2824122 RepID=A0ABT0KI78_9GAMM|nr:type VI secretion system tip protein VgrG [Serratia silvae]MCL1031492.1 type VI secretion system tip protein VgrG [Serratia silvae]